VSRANKNNAPEMIEKRLIIAEFRKASFLQWCEVF